MSNCVLVFAGTIEGREIVEHLIEHGIRVYASVATEYGKSLYQENEKLTVLAQRMDANQMSDLFKEIQPEFVLDATHPYAKEVTENIKKACENTGFSYVRLLRETQDSENVVYVESLDKAVEYLNQTSGRVFLTTGSKELSAFTGVKNYQERLYARVLSLPQVVETSSALGFQGEHLICMQGPFSRELNEAMLRQTKAEILVTKDTGDAGGFFEKYLAAKNCGVQMVVIGRPIEEDGMSPQACRRFCQEKLGYDFHQKVTLVGIGMGDEKTITQEAKDAIENASLIIGAQRMVDAVIRTGQASFVSYKPDEIVAFLQNHQEYENAVIALSGDVGFFSGAKKLLEQLEGKAEVICGISSMAYFCGKLGKEWEDVKPVTMHGRDNNLVGMILRYQKIFCLMGTEDGIGSICSKMTTYGYGHLQCAIGENLSYEKERIRIGPMEDFADIKTEKLCVLYVENPKANNAVVTYGIPDEEFLRAKVPMTKEEVRSISISKLRLCKNSIIYDIGAGTGSLSVEMALTAYEGRVYALEKKEEAVELILENKERFAADNLEVIRVTAPEGMADLPAPTHAFIGGSSGNLREIMELLFEKNPNVRIVVNAITLETMAETMECIRIMEIEDVDIAQVTVAKSRELGSYHLMMGQNPVYVISMQGRNGKDCN